MPYQFRGQHRNEEVVLLCRQHPMVLLHSMLVAGFFLVVPLGVNIFLSVGNILALLTVFCVVYGILHGYLAWYAWYNSMLLVTTERVVYLEQRSILQREFVECTLENIRQVSHEVVGVFRTVFGFGSISIFSGGSQQPVVVKNMPEPYEIQQEIQRVAAGEVDEG